MIPSYSGIIINTMLQTNTFSSVFYFGCASTCHLHPPLFSFVLSPLFCGVFVSNCFKICYWIYNITQHQYLARPVSTPMFDWGRLLTPSQKLWCFLDRDRWQKSSQMVVCRSGNSAKIDPAIQILGHDQLPKWDGRKCEKYFCVYMFVMLASCLLNRSVLELNATTRAVNDLYDLLNILFRQCDPSSAFFGQLGRSKNSEMLV